jgi:thiaminase/transcriptional activator TenA
VLVGGVVALEAELAWFEGHASLRGLELGSSRHATTAGYREFLLALDEAAYAAAITGLWALERAYLEAWNSAAPGGGGYAEFVEHWTAPAFEEYVDGLAAAADRALEQATADERASARNAFLEVARLERDFWAIASV